MTHNEFKLESTLKHFRFYSRNKSGRGDCIEGTDKILKWSFIENSFRISQNTLHSSCLKLKSCSSNFTWLSDSSYVYRSTSQPTGYVRQKPGTPNLTFPLPQTLYPVITELSVSPPQS